MPSAYNWPVRVYYEDTDAGGIVYHANYLKFFERGRTEFLRALGIEQQTLIDADHTGFVVRSMTLDYRFAARLDDELSIRTSVTKVGGASVQFLQEAWCGEVLLNSANVKIGCVDVRTTRPRSLPDDVAAKMRAA